MNEAAGKYIVIEGPVGVGKTTLARRLAQSLGCEPMLESPEENPFLPHFYEQPRRYALPTQLFFLFQRTRQIQSLQQADLFTPVRVGDFLLEKDRLFAELTLTPEELNLYNQVEKHLAVEAAAPDLVIYLQAPAPVLLQRIARRGVAYERRISEDYLNRLVEAYVRFFHHYDAAPLLIVNATEIDLANDEADCAALLERVRQAPPGRHYVNLRY